MKQQLKRHIVKLLERRVIRLRQKNDFIVVAVVGSIGKTSTKLAIAELLATHKRVQYQAGNYNVDVTVPLVFFGLPIPSLMNPFAWLLTFMRIDRMLRRPYPYDVVVVELGTDMPGQLAEFRYIQPDIGVLTAITAEHMEFFKTIHAVAQEETTIASYTKRLLVNADLCPAEYVPQVLGRSTYGTSEGVTYKITGQQLNQHGYACVLHKDNSEFIRIQTSAIGQPQLYSVTAAVAVADLLELSAEQITQGIGAIQPVKGRLQVLPGIQGSTIIDDTYNASPEAMKAALQTLYDMPGDCKIALLGNMNELGDYAPSAHAEIGALCDPAHLKLVVTLGPDANDQLAAAAEKRGCRVIRANTPYMAADAIGQSLEANCVILAKGSQNRVYAEEAVKQLLANPQDAGKLVRQSRYWMQVKDNQFGAHS